MTSKATVCELAAGLGRADTQHVEPVAAVDVVLVEVVAHLLGKVADAHVPDPEERLALAVVREELVAEVVPEHPPVRLAVIPVVAGVRAEHGPTRVVDHGVVGPAVLFDLVEDRELMLVAHGARHEAHLARHRRQRQQVEQRRRLVEGGPAPGERGDECREAAHRRERPQPAQQHEVVGVGRDDQRASDDRDDDGQDPEASGARREEARGEHDRGEGRGPGLVPEGRYVALVEEREGLVVDLVLRGLQDGDLEASRQHPEGTRHRQRGDAQPRRAAEEDPRMGDEGKALAPDAARHGGGAGHEVAQPHPRQGQTRDEGHLLGHAGRQGGERAADDGERPAPLVAVPLEQQQAGAEVDGPEVVRAVVDGRHQSEAEGEGQEGHEHRGHPVARDREAAPPGQQREQHPVAEDDLAQQQGAGHEVPPRQEERRVQHVAQREVVLEEVDVGDAAPGHAPGGMAVLVLVHGEEAGLGEGVDLAQGVERRRRQHEERDCLEGAFHAGSVTWPSRSARAVDSSSRVVIAASSTYW